jgi:sortase A
MTLNLKHIDWKMAALVVFFLIGIGIMLYPFVCNAYYQYQADKWMDEYSAVIEDGDNEEYAQAIAEAQEYNQVLVGQTVPDVFAIREGTTDETYEGMLNVLGNQIMGSIEIPVIDVNLPIYHYSTVESLEKGCGHIFGSSLPVGGDSSHAVITAHRGLPTAKMFTDLDQLEKGDKFYLHILDQTLAYEVIETETVAPDETRSLAIQEGEDLVTLVTCTPYGVNTDRLLVHAQRVPYEPGDENAPVKHHMSSVIANLLKGACILAGVLAATILAWVLRKRREHARRLAEYSVGSRDGAAVGAASETDAHENENVFYEVDMPRTNDGPLGGTNWRNLDE